MPDKTSDVQECVLKLFYLKCIILAHFISILMTNEHQLSPCRLLPGQLIYTQARFPCGTVSATRFWQRNQVIKQETPYHGSCYWGLVLLWSFHTCNPVPRVWRPCPSSGESVGVLAWADCAELVIPLSFPMTDTNADKPGVETGEEKTSQRGDEQGGVEVSQWRARRCLRPISEVSD